MKKLFGPARDGTELLSRDYFLADGKRLRPMLTILACEAFGTKISDDDLSRLALSIECFHKASLIHDDIEDNDTTRYGKETLHAKYGVPVAINAGDLLIGEGYRLIAETCLSPEVLIECIRTAAEGHRLLSVGQGMELMAVKNRNTFSLEEVLLVFDYKASTAFKVALLLGAIAGAADDASKSLLIQFSHFIGIAYQIMDDIEDFTDEEGKIDLNKPSVFLSLLSEKLSHDDQVMFQEAYSRSDVMTIRRLCTKYCLQAYASELLSEYLSQLQACLVGFQNPVLKLALHEFVGKVFDRYLNIPSGNRSGIPVYEPEPYF